MVIILPLKLMNGSAKAKIGEAKMAMLKTVTIYTNAKLNGLENILIFDFDWFNNLLNFHL